MSLAEDVHKKDCKVWTYRIVIPGPTPQPPSFCPTAKVVMRLGFYGYIFHMVDVEAESLNGSNGPMTAYHAKDETEEAADKQELGWLAESAFIPLAGGAW